MPEIAMIAIRTMTTADIPLGMRLKEQAGWNQTEADWQRFLHLEPDGCFVVERGGTAAGTVATCVFDAVAWVAMVLVDAPLRHQGLGTRLVRNALEYLDGRGVRTVRLDATHLGRPIYEAFGFRTQYELTRWEGTASAAASEPRVERAPPEMLDAIVALDRQVSGNDRRRFLSRLWHEAGGFWVAREGETLLGYMGVRRGSRAMQIGPGAALSPKAGWALGGAALIACAGKGVHVDVPTQNDAATAWARSAGLVAQRNFTRMVRGEPISDQPDRLWASSGPELG